MSRPMLDPMLLNTDCLQVSTSVIPASGRGVFVTRDVKQGEVLGQYFGDVFGPGAKVVTTPETDDKMYTTKENKTIVPDPTCLAQFINDCINLEAVETIALEGLYEICEEYNTSAFTCADARAVVQEVLKMTDEDVVEFTHQHDCSLVGEQVPIILEHNVDWEERFGRVFIVAKRDIDRGEELFIDYGDGYWTSSIVKMMRKKYFDLWVEQNISVGPKRSNPQRERDASIATPKRRVKDRRTRRRKRPVYA